VKYVQVVNWSAEDDGVHLEMLDEDREVHRFDVSAECAGVLVGALAAEAEKLNAEGRDQQFIRPTALQTARTEAGEPMILLTLASGVELPLVFKPESLGVLIAELESLRDGLQPPSQVRWQ
jgi:hypothetical protein